MRRTASSVLLLAALLAGESGAREIVSKGPVTVELSGSLRQIAQWTRQTDADDFAAAIEANLPQCVLAALFPDCPAFDLVGKKEVWQSLTRLRMRLDLDIGERVDAAIAYDNELFAGAIGTLSSGFAESFATESFLGAEELITGGTYGRWSHGLYRAYVDIELDRLQVIVGRQRIAWGVGRLWTPIDRFNAIPPLALEGDQTRGVDAIDAHFNFDGFNQLEAVYAPGTSRKEARYALRFHGVVLDTDVSVVVGRFELAPTVGFDLTRNVGDAAVRVEAVWADPRREVWRIGDPGPRAPDDFWQVVLSADYNFQVGTGIYAVIEYFYNGNALGFGEDKAGSLLSFFESTDVPPDPALSVLPGPYVTVASPAIFGTSRVVTTARHQTGLSVGYDLTPELRADLLTIADWSGPSAIFFPTLSISPLDFAELRLGTQLGVGGKRSQYGEAEPLVYLIAELFF